MQKCVVFVIFVNNLCMEKILLPLPNGVVVRSGDKKVCSTILPDGKKNLTSFKEQNKVIFWNVPFARGLQYFFCGIFALLCELHDFGTEIFRAKKIARNAKNDKNTAKNAIFCAFCVLFGVIFAAIVLGFLPAKLAYLLVDFRGSEILRNALVGVFKILFFVFFISLFRFFPAYCEFLRFNRAADMALLMGDKLKRHNCPARPLNFLNFLVFVFVLDFGVISLVGADFGFFFNFLFHLAVLLACASACYELLWLIEKVSALQNLAWITAFLVYATPTTTHLETAYVAVTELGLLVSQKDREFMGNENHAFAVVYSEVRERLAAAGVNDKSEADWLIATILGKNRAEIKLVASVTDKQYQEIQKATTRRAKGESLDNIFGYTEFYGLRFDVNKKVLTPRMETEILVENVLKAAKNMAESRKKLDILDLGTGSGAIAVTLAKNCDAHITAVDISKTALATAEANAKKHGVKVEFVHSNLFEGLKRRRKFDIIVSNPPYIKSGDIKNLDKNVRECDPLLALDGGEDGLDFYREIIPSATRRLTAGGMIFFEIGKGQGAAVRKIMRENGYNEIKTIKDYNKIERIVSGKFIK